MYTLPKMMCVEKEHMCRDEEIVTLGLILFVECLEVCLML
jgi:hypothetical protein